MAKLQAISGIHYNMELGRSGRCLFQVRLYHSLKDFKNDLYLKLARNFLAFPMAPNLSLRLLLL